MAKTDPSSQPGDRHFMGMAVSLARRGLGRVAPNPAVGCVLVRPTDDGGEVIARGWTQPGGRPHAETEALSRAGVSPHGASPQEASARGTTPQGTSVRGVSTRGVSTRGATTRGATAYVSLEPCSHHGKTPPCAKALIEAGVSRVVIAVTDPDPRVSGAGIKMLEEAGIEVTTGVLEAEATDLNEGFFKTIVEGRPLFTLKTATTLDGRIATRTGHSQWITGPVARGFGHRLRADHDGILVGIGTALADDPTLTCRLPGMADHSPVRIVADSNLRLPLDSKLVQTAKDVPVWVLCAEGADSERTDALIAHGVEVIPVPADDQGHVDLAAAAGILAEHGMTRVLIESGGKLAAEFLRRSLVDHIAWFRSSSIIGGDGIPAADLLGVETVDQAPEFERTGTLEADGDMMETYRRKRGQTRD